MFSKEEIKARLREEFNARGKPVEAGYNLACLIADSALFHQKDKAGNDYAHHTSFVSRHNTQSETKMIIGKLHDVVEDSDWTLDDLREVGFSEAVIAGVDAMTRREKEGEPYFDFIVRCGQNRHAIDVKLSDLNHNMTLSRNNTLPTARDTARWAKYMLAYNYLLSIKREEVAPGTPMAAWMRQQKPELQDWNLLRAHSRPDPGAPAASPA